MKIGDLVRYKLHDYGDIGIIVAKIAPKAFTVLWAGQNQHRIELMHMLEVYNEGR